MYFNATRSCAYISYRAWYCDPMARIAVSRADAGRPGKPETAPMKSKNGLKIEGVARSGVKGPIKAPLEVLYVKLGI